MKKKFLASSTAHEYILMNSSQFWSNINLLFSSSCLCTRTLEHPIAIKFSTLDDDDDDGDGRERNACFLANVELAKFEQRM